VHPNDQNNFDWTTFDKIAIATGGYNYQGHELVEIASVSDSTCGGAPCKVIGLQTQLKYDHRGVKETHTRQAGEVATFDMRPEVSILTRTVSIEGMKSTDPTVVED